jgi:hypothetical protein
MKGSTAGINRSAERTMTKSRQDEQAKDQNLPNEDELLDEALDETFPASDPIAIHPEPETEDERRGIKR